MQYTLYLCTPVCDCVSPSCTQRREAWKRRGGVAWRQFAAECSVWLLPLGVGRNSKDFFFQWIIVVNNRDINIDQNNRDNHFGNNRAALECRPNRPYTPSAPVRVSSFIKTFGSEQSLPYIEQCVAQRHRINTERHKLILLFFFKRFSDFEI